MKVKVSNSWLAANGMPLNYNTGYCDMVPYRNSFFKYVDLYSVLINGSYYKMSLNDFKVIGEDDISKIKKANNFSMAKYISNKIELTKSINEALYCKIFITDAPCVAFELVGHFKNELLNDFLPIIGLESKDREWFSYMYGQFVWDYCKENNLPILEINTKGRKILLKNSNLNKHGDGLYEIDSKEVLDKLIQNITDFERDF